MGYAVDTLHHIVTWKNEGLDVYVTDPELQEWAENIAYADLWEEMRQVDWKIDKLRVSDREGVVSELKEWKHYARRIAFTYHHKCQLEERG